MHHTQKHKWNHTTHTVLKPVLFTYHGHLSTSIQLNHIVISEKYKVCPEVSSHMLQNTETFIEEDTRYKKHCTQEDDASVPFQSRHLTQVNLTYVRFQPHTVLPASLPLFKTLQNPLLESPSAAPLYFPEFHQWSEISSLSKLTLVLGITRSHKAPNLGCRGAESPG